MIKFFLLDDIPSIKDVIDEYNKGTLKNSQFFVAILIFLVINLIITIISFIKEIKLKNKEKKIHSHNLKEERRINIAEEIYKKLYSISLLDRNQTQQMLTDVTSVEKFIVENGLYIQKEYGKTAHDYIDYFKSVLISFNNKNFKTESDFQNELIRIFNK